MLAFNLKGGFKTTNLINQVSTAVWQTHRASQPF